MPIHKRGNVYHVNVQLNGVSFRGSCGKGATLEQAKQYEAQIRRDIINGKLGNVSYTLADAAAKWLEGEAKSLKDYRGLVNNIKIIRKHLKHKIDQAPLAVQKIVEESQDLTPATINRRIAIIRRLCNLAWKWGWIKYPPKIEMLSGEKSRHVYLTIPEVIKLAKASGPIKWHVILAAFTGMRQGELLSLKPEMVKDGVIYLTETKSGKPRAIPLNRPALCAVERLNWSIPYHTIRWHFERARGARNVRWHDLRHTAASFMVRGGASMTAVRDLLGHSNLGVTSRYSHLAVEGLKSEVDKMLNFTKITRNKRKAA